MKCPVWFLPFCILTLAAGSAHGRVELLAPEDNAVLPSVPAAQRLVMAKPTQGERRSAAACEQGPWGESASITVSWRMTGGESGPWLIRIGADAELRDGKDWWILKKVLIPDYSGVYKYTLANANLVPGRRYWWRVWCNVKCSEWECGSAIGPNGCACGKTGPAPASEIRTFIVEDVPPRWIALEGRTKNMRDLGGWRTTDGKRVRYGMVFRGEAMNDNSVSGDVPGRNRLTVEDVEFLTRTLGIKTELDLRTGREVSSMKGSPMGPSVTYVHRSSLAYKEIFSPEGMKAMGENFRLFCDKKNYPVFFHCIGGADRTGSLAYVLNGALGVAKEDLERDWELTFYPDIPNVVDNLTGKRFTDSTDWRSSSHFDDGFAKYAKDGDTLRDRICAYLKDCGVTENEIKQVREIMLDRPMDGKHGLQMTEFSRK